MEEIEILQDLQLTLEVQFYWDLGLHFHMQKEPESDYLNQET